LGGSTFEGLSCLAQGTTVRGGGRGREGGRKEGSDRRRLLLLLLLLSVVEGEEEGGVEVPGEEMIGGVMMMARLPD